VHTVLYSLDLFELVSDIGLCYGRVVEVQSAAVTLPIARLHLRIYLAGIDPDLVFIVQRFNRPFVVLQHTCYRRRLLSDYIVRLKK